jgi:type VI protein secretion system component VasF
MKILDICEPVFLYVSILNRAANLDVRSTDYEYENVRATMERLFAEMLPKAGADLELQAQVRQIELPMMFFVDSMIASSRLEFAGKWNTNRLAFKRNEYAGDQKFFILLNNALQAYNLKDTNATAAEQLTVYYACLGLGFRGIHASKPQQLRQYMDDITRLIGTQMDRNWNEEIIKDHFVDRTNLVVPPSQMLVIIAILFLCLTLATLITYVWTFREASRSLSSSITTIVNSSNGQ